MTFADLHERLRLELLRRIEAGTLTGSRLAQQAGFQQAHISNFLNRKRSLSLEGLDRVLAAQKISIDQILPVELAASENNASTPTEMVPLVAASVAMDAARIPAAAVIESIPVSESLLYENRSRAAPGNMQWQRFVGLRMDAQHAAAMEPVLGSGSIVILDRHYTSLALYRSQQRNLYAVRIGNSLVVRYVDLEEKHLILRPYSIAHPAQLVTLRSGQSPSDLIVGRVCLVLSEL
jgi:transcriptional regulator with XRE-family HTH domain